MKNEPKRVRGGSKTASPLTTGAASPMKDAKGLGDGSVIKSAQTEGARLEGGPEEQVAALGIAVTYVLVGWGLPRGGLGVMLAFPIFLLLQLCGAIAGLVMLSSRHPRWLAIGLLFGSFLSCGSCMVSFGTLQ